MQKQRTTPKRNQHATSNGGTPFMALGGGTHRGAARNAKTRNQTRVRITNTMLTGPLAENLED